MKIIYFDCIGGISGDMFLAAMLDAGLPFTYLKQELIKLKISGFRITKAVVERGHTKAVKFSVEEKDKRLRKSSEVRRIVIRSGLKPAVKKLAMGIYEELGKAEGLSHHCRVKDFSFEELGRLDSLVDIVGAAIALNYFCADKYFVSPLPVTSRLAPATTRLLKGLELKPVDYDYETVTPTGAAILKTINAISILACPVSFTLKQCGFGAGSFNPGKISNVLRVMLGEGEENFEEDRVVGIETNIDDLNPQVFEYLQEELFAAGALEVFIQPIQMKKFRPGFLLTVLTSSNVFDKVVNIIFKETTSFGIRYYSCLRKKLIRQFKTVKTSIGSCRVKLGSSNGLFRTLSPEYEDCKRLARNSGLSFRRVYEYIKNEGKKQWHFPD
ncbi:MAG: nickel pincer cofactor biosynthesis protein LarC [Candidatus Omnitrophota bacterium]